MKLTDSRVEKALRSLARGGSDIDTSSDFYGSAMQSLAEAFGAKYAFIALLKPDDSSHVETIAVCADGDIAPNFGYALSHTPCAEVVGESKQLIPHGIKQAYPNDMLLINMELESYFGAPLIFSNGRKCGLLVVTHTEPLHIEPWMDLLLDVFASRIARELESKESASKVKDSERYNRMLFNESPIGLALCHMDGRLVDANPAYCSILGRGIDEIKALTYWDITPEEYANQEREQLEILESTGHYGPYEKEYIHKNGHRIPVSLTGRLVKQNGEAYIWSSVEDISKRVVVEKALSESTAKLQAILDLSPTLISIKDLDGRFILANNQFENILECSATDMIGKTLFDLFPAELAQSIANNDKAALKADLPIEVEEVIVHANDSKHTYLTSKFPLTDNKTDQAFGVCSISTDITERKQAEETIRHMAFHDSLTGLINRNEFENRLMRALSSTREREIEHALLYLDLDQFKVINDTCGHSAGDEMLRQLGNILHQKVRERDTIARLGGDEFGILMENCPLAYAIEAAEALVPIISNYRFAWEGRSFAIGVSIGISAITANSKDAEEILKEADMACYAAKDLGRNRTHVYYPDDKDLAKHERDMHWVADIREAIDKNRFVLYRQSIQDLHGNSLETRYEYLVRMLGKSDELIKPGSFISSAERYNLMPEVDRWIIANIFKHLNASQPPETTNMVDVFINLSGTSLNDPALADYIRSQLEMYNVDARRICFEVTETAAVANLSRATQFVNNIHALGCRFALDDFGTGVSSFSYLKALPVDYLKIDGGFVKNMLNDSMDCTIVHVIQEIGTAAGIQTIAEYVEDSHLLSKVKDMGIDYAQGYYIDRPQAVYN